MTTCIVIINDFPKDRRTTVVFSSEEYEQVENAWEIPDTLLAELQNNALFAGRTTWSELDPTHFRVMLMRNLTIVSDLIDAQRTDDEHPAVKSLHFLCCALIICLQHRAESYIEMLRINRLGENEVAFDYAASLNLAMDIPKQPASGLRVIVDNT